jgi:hypothetical protein
VQHVSRDENTVANDLVQQASGLQENHGKFSFLKNRMFRFAKLDIPFLAGAQCKNLFC